MVFTYTSATPTGTNPPSQDRPLMTGNFQYLATFGGQDHQFPASTATLNVGTHKQVTLSNLSGTPGFANANCVLFAKNDSHTVSQVWFDNSGTPVQLTAKTPVSNITGYSYLPGGMLIQWDRAVASNGAAVVFPVAFASGAYAIQVNCANGGSVVASAINFTNTQFTLSVSIGAPITYTYLAIGPA